MFAFLNHQFIAFRRSRNQGKSIAARIVIALFTLYILLLAIGAGFFMEEVIEKVFPQREVLEVFTSFIIYYFLLDILMRLQLQELPVLQIVPYLHLNIAKSKMVNFLNLRALFSAFNLLPLFVFLPFVYSNIIDHEGVFPANMFCTAIVSLIVFNNYLALYLKRKSISNISSLIVIVLVVAGLLALDYFKIISTSDFSTLVFNAVLGQPLVALIFAGIAVASLVMHARFLKNNLYTEELSKNKKAKASTDYPFLDRFGRVGELAALELKLIFRHKRSRTSLYASIIFLAYGFIFYRAPELDSNSFGGMLFAAIFVTGSSSMFYGQYMFAWQSGHFDGLLANKISLSDFMKAKFLLISLSSVVTLFLSLLYGFLSWKLLVLHLATFLYNIGFGTVVILFFATRNYKRLDLASGSALNWQGTSSVQWIMMLPFLIIPYVIYIPLQLAGHPFWGLTALGTFGLINLLMRNVWIKYLTQLLQKNRYTIAEGFRE